MALDTVRLAVLIDADNSPASIADSLFEEIAGLGDASIRRIYGDFSGTRMGRWQSVLARHAINPTQQFAYTTGKNASDITLVIEAMDLLHLGRVDGFCLVSSDSDFTRLASRIREQGLLVYGFGAKKTPEAFIQACTRFIYIENLGGAEVEEDRPPAPRARVSARPAPAPVPAAEKPLRRAEPLPEPMPEAVVEPEPRGSGPSPADALPLIRKAMDRIQSDSGWYQLGVLGTVIGKMSPDFDPRSYGHAKLSTLLRKTGAFRERKREDGGMEVAEKD